jgi:hypothetical protein
MDPEPEHFEDALKFSAKQRDKKARDIASNCDIETIRKRLYNLYNKLNRLPLAKGILGEAQLERGVSNLSILLDIETRALRIKAGV